MPTRLLVGAALQRYDLEAWLVLVTYRNEVHMALQPMMFSASVGGRGYHNFQMHGAGWLLADENAQFAAIAY